MLKLNNLKYIYFSYTKSLKFCLKKSLSVLFKNSFICSFGCAGSSLLPGLSPVVVHRQLLLFQSAGSRVFGFRQLYHMGPVSSCGSRALEHRLSHPPACGISPDQGLNPCLLHWQVDSLPLSLPQWEDRIQLFSPLWYLM